MSSSTKRKPQGSRSAAAGKKKRTVKPASDNDLAMVEQLTTQERKTANELKAAPIDSSTLSDVTEVREMNRAEVLTEIDLVLFKVLQSIIAGKGFEFNIPSRAASNQEYIKELDRIVLKRSKLMSRAFVNVSSAKKATYMARAITIVYEVLRKGIHTTKRDLFYSDAKLFGDQSNSDGVLGDIACLLGCTRTSLHVVASDRGVVVGRVRYVEDGDEIDCTKMGVGGKAIPPHLNKVENIQSDAKFILLVEKDAAFARLAEDRFYNTFPCIIITAKGQPDVASRRFLKRLRNTLQIPVLGLVDSDPYGLKILSVYMSGSKSMSYDSASLSTQGIKWLGVRPSDLDRYNIPEVCRLDMSAGDIKTGEALLKEDFIKQNPEWVAELELMLKTKKKAEIQALSSFGFQYLTQQYLPEKIKNGDWI